MNTNRSPLSAPAGSSTGQPGSLPGLFWRVCAWCGHAYGLEFCEPSRDGEVSHGMCVPCFNKAMGYLVVLFIPWSILAMAGGIQ